MIEILFHRTYTKGLRRTSSTEDDTTQPSGRLREANHTSWGCAIRWAAERRTALSRWRLAPKCQLMRVPRTELGAMNPNVLYQDTRQRDH